MDQEVNQQFGGIVVIVLGVLLDTELVLELILVLLGVIVLSWVIVVPVI